MCLPLEKIFDAAQALLSKIQAKSSQQSQSAPPTSMEWKPTKPKFYKVNYDGAMFADLGEAGIGVVVRNQKGEVMAPLAKKLLTLESVEMLEALVARRASIFFPCGTGIAIGCH